VRGCGVRGCGVCGGRVCGGHVEMQAEGDGHHDEHVEVEERPFA